MMCGMPNLHIHAEQSASARVVTVVVVSGTASVLPVVLYHDVENVGETLWRWKSAYEVHMNVRKTAFWDGNGRWRGWDVSVNFGFLAGYALACPFSNASGHVGPNKTCGNETTCGSDAGLAYGVMWWTISCWNWWEMRGQNVFVETSSKWELWWKRYGSDMQRRQALQSGFGLACLLCIGYVSVRKRQRKLISGHSRWNCGCWRCFGGGWLRCPWQHVGHHILVTR